MLGLLVYCVRALAAEIFLPACQRQVQGAAETQGFLQQRASYLVESSYSPMSVMVSLLSYAKFISLRTPSSIASSMWWSQDQQTFFIKGRPVELERFCAMAQGIVADAKCLLWEELLWVKKKEDQLSENLAKIQDDVTITQRGASFLPPSRLQEGRDWMLKQLSSVPAAQLLYHNQLQLQQQNAACAVQETGVQWKEQEVQKHLRRVDRFLELLCLAVHITGGQPARGSELLSVRWRNGALQDRNLYVIDGEVVVVTRYHKTQAQWDQPKVVARFLPEPVGQLVTAYLLYVQPLRAILLQHSKKGVLTTAAADYI
jgi:hypothetical protein